MKEATKRSSLLWSADEEKTFYNLDSRTSQSSFGGRMLVPGSSKKRRAKNSDDELEAESKTPLFIGVLCFNQSARSVFRQVPRSTNQHAVLRHLEEKCLEVPCEFSYFYLVTVSHIL